jgi:hypothetical protein
MTGSDGAKPRFEAVTPRIPVQDVEEALTFYRNPVGIRSRMEVGYAGDARQRVP